MILSTEWADADGKNGLIVPSHSWLRQMAQFWSGFMGSNLEVAGVPGIKAIDGVVYIINLPSDWGNVSNFPVFLADADAAITTHGILVGTGVTAVTKSDHVMETLIAEGTGAGQLSYGKMEISHAYGITGGYRVTVSRLLQNDSGGDITVKECGFGIESTDTGLTKRTFLLIHDLQTQLISDTEGKVFKYHMDFLV